MNKKMNNDQLPRRSPLKKKFESPQRNGFAKDLIHSPIPSSDISQYSDGASYIVTELESEPHRRGVSRLGHDQRQSRKYQNGNVANASSAPASRSISSSSNLSSKTVPNGHLGSRSPSKSVSSSRLHHEVPK